MRIATLITMFSIISFLSVAFPKAYVYIHPWLGFVEAFAIGSFFLLLCDFISPNDDQRDIYIAAKRHNGAKWFRVWIDISNREDAQSWLTNYLFFFLESLDHDLSAPNRVVYRRCRNGHHCSCGHILRVEE